MLKVNDGTVIEGIFNDESYIEIVKKSKFSTLIIHIDISEFESKCIEVVSVLAEHGLQYAKDFVIARARNES
jgi:hypothetical protein